MIKKILFLSFISCPFFTTAAAAHHLQSWAVSFFEQVQISDEAALTATKELSEPNLVIRYKNKEQTKSIDITPLGLAALYQRALTCSELYSKGANPLALITVTTVNIKGKTTWTESVLEFCTRKKRGELTTILTSPSPAGSELESIFNGFMQMESSF